MGLVEKAERKSRARAILFYMSALILPISAFLMIHGRGDDGARLAIWFAMIGMTALNLTSLPFRSPWSRPVSRLMNDETTRDHRRSSLAIGFWAMLAAACATVMLSGGGPLGAAACGQITITAGLTAALVAFATLELRASR
ncbi:hypothetical protein [Sphingomonas sanguinis]|jgi:hypothetical protein|uniref:Uncharacterized protein n=2 Tax=Sphingomonas sanguinis TaxID=33051 RepID=A0A7Y7QY85_9SPHN|nr:hypothetical protein [Sphingomonas sanguinis]MBZ6383626.1 hypothetical protein [Sphingomonas sanguinis]NNG48103.1 hypothetical protein [Sphingomonas sanguinis]NNG53805.1 hypothetical protein [Sphingomonas sanguinis]NVP32920.1 hypothetical protein [Sphingomonas sanguinis]